MAKRRLFSAGPDAAFDGVLAAWSPCVMHLTFSHALIISVSARSSISCRSAESFFHEKTHSQTILFLSSNGCKRTGFWAQSLFITLFHFIYSWCESPFLLLHLASINHLIHRRYDTIKLRSSYHAHYRAFLKILSANEKEFERFEIHTTSLSKKQWKYVEFCKEILISIKTFRLSAQ